MQNHGRTLLRCPGCGFAWVAEGLAKAEGGHSIYDGDNPVFFEDGNEAYYLGAPSLVNAGIKLDLMRRHVPAGARVLDVGAGFGHFVKVAGGHYAVHGIEVSPVAIVWAKDNLGVTLERGTAETLTATDGSLFDAATLWDVIEHVEDPRQALRQVAERLAPDGIVVLSTPDLGSLVARLLGRRWYYLDLIQHVHLFSRKTLGRLLAESGFTVLSWGSMGHRYELGYVLSRLDYFYGRSLLGRLLLAPLRAMPAAWLGRQITINPHDVLTVVARKAVP